MAVTAIQTHLEPQHPTLVDLFPGAQFQSATRTTAKFALLSVDAGALLLAAAIGNVIQWLYYAPGNQGILELWIDWSGKTTLGIYAGLVFVALARFWTFGHYTRRRPFWDETRETLIFVSFLAVLDAALMYLGKLSFSRSWFLSTWALALVLVPVSRVMLKRLLLKFRLWQTATIIIGAGDNAREAAEALHSEKLMGLEVVAFCALQPAEISARGCIRLFERNIPVVFLGDPVKDIAAIGQPSIVVAPEKDDLASIQRLTERLHRRFDDLSIVPALKGLPLYGMEINHFFRHEALFLRLRNNLTRRAPRLLKRAFDVVVSFALLVLLSPLFAYIAAQIRKTGGPVFFGHHRIGYTGKTFKCYKFRSMVPNAQQLLTEVLAKDASARAEWERDFKLKNDPRVTPIGAFLRKTSLDELPQLWNVLRGDMSLVGPRPIIAAELERYGDHAAYYLETRPGMSGLWQISGRNDTNYANRVYLDSWYVKNWSLWQDVVILISTTRVILKKTGAY